MTKSMTITIASLIADYADGIAFVAEEQPATNVPDFTAQVRNTIRNFELAGINGTEELEDAATYLDDADASTDDNERAVLLNRAAVNLAYADDMVDEYRDMV
ncbi:hypothetical protein KZO11_17505 [Streptomyces anulatus]|uniref:hypothetical protein n=1 Tax=Streptomyces anulatus TaxID=1892 RepID=UPI001C5E25B5|nr:hypothetical protein [Streptomyces anulatus]QYA95322.1 hypothetical protein KZO11_17505 [Streptomyces anulatus]